MARSSITTEQSAIADLAIQHRLENSPLALPAQRIRSLTLSENDDINLSHTLNSIHLSTANLQKGFFTLPLELRQKIYQLSINAPEDEYHSGKSVVQLIQTKENRLYYVSCPWHGHSWHYTRCFQAEENDYRGLVPHLYNTEHFDWCGNSREGGYERIDGMLGVLMVCKQMYRETIDILYGYHQFYLRHLFTVIDLARTILPQRMNAIRSLRLVIPLIQVELQDLFESRMAERTGHDETCLQQAFRIIAGMEGLKELDVEFQGNIDMDPERKRNALLPLAAVRQTDRFDVRVPWNEGHAGDQLDNVPYKLFGPGDGVRTNRKRTVVNESSVDRVISRGTMPRKQLKRHDVE